MKSQCGSALVWCRNLLAGWDRFWFTPADPATLAAVRICTGLVLLYTHLTCTFDLLSFVGPDAWVDAVGQLVRHASLRHRLGLAGRRVVEQDYHVERGGQLWLDVLRDLHASSIPTRKPA